MPYTAEQIIEWCESEWNAWKGDCSGFAKAVCAQANVQLNGQANQIIDFLGTSPVWENLGAEPGKAIMRANGDAW
jgi:hypothetical protein